MRQSVSAIPFQKPWIRNASRAYAEQVGVNRQHRGFSGLMKLW